MRVAKKQEILKIRSTNTEFVNGMVAEIKMRRKHLDFSVIVGNLEGIILRFARQGQKQFLM